MAMSFRPALAFARRAARRSLSHHHHYHHYHHYHQSAQHGKSTSAALAETQPLGPPRGRRPDTLTWQSPIGPVTVSWTRQDLLVRRHGETEQRLKPASIRDGCECPWCRDESSGQKTFSSVDIPPDLGVSHARATEAGLAVSFHNDVAGSPPDHETLLPWDALLLAPQNQKHDLASRRRAILRRTGVHFWDAATLSRQVRSIPYQDFITTSSSLADVIVDLCRLGIVFLRDVPRSESSINLITTRIANVRETLYGRTFDVRAKPRAENVAYTNTRLGLHQDLCYLSPPPMIQVLHCMDNSARGGQSLFSDGERVGRLLWPYVHRDKFAPLVHHPVPYRYTKHGHMYHVSRALMSLDARGDFRGVYWSPPFQAPPDDLTRDLQDWIRPAAVFDSLVNDSDAVFTAKLRPGDCVLFDNLRVMHGRTAFDAAGGERWLRGAYIAAEDFFSKAAYIPEGHAERYRGPREWTPEDAQRDLAEGPWHAQALDRVRSLDPGVES